MIQLVVNTKLPKLTQNIFWFKQPETNTNTNDEQSNFLNIFRLLLFLMHDHVYRIVFVTLTWKLNARAFTHTKYCFYKCLLIIKSIILITEYFYCIIRLNKYSFFVFRFYVRKTSQSYHFLLSQKILAFGQYIFICCFQPLKYYLSFAPTVIDLKYNIQTKNRIVSKKCTEYEILLTTTPFFLHDFILLKHVSIFKFLFSIWFSKIICTNLNMFLKLQKLYTHDRALYCRFRVITEALEMRYKNPYFCMVFGVEIFLVCIDVVIDFLGFHIFLFHFYFILFNTKLTLC